MASWGAFQERALKGHRFLNIIHPYRRLAQAGFKQHSIRKGRIAALSPRVLNILTASRQLIGLEQPV
jgi:hypothetical protein